MTYKPPTSFYCVLCGDEKPTLHEYETHKCTHALFFDGDGKLVTHVTDMENYDDHGSLTQRPPEARLAISIVMPEEDDETCPHGLSLDLCVDPINHYPPDNYF